MQTRWSVVLLFAVGALASATSAQDPPPVEEEFPELLPDEPLTPPPPPLDGEEVERPAAPPPEPPGRVQVGLTAARAASADLRIGVDAESETLDLVLARIGRAAGVPVVVEPEVQEGLTISLREVPWRDAVEVIARMVRCEVVDLPGGGALLRRPVLVDLEVVESDVREVLQLIGRVAGRSVLLSHDVRGLVSARFVGSPWRDALATIAKAAGGLHVVEGDGYVLVGTTPPPASLHGQPTSFETFAAFGDARVDVVAERADPADVAEAIGRAVGKTILVDPSAPSRVDLHLTGAPWGLAVGLLALELGCDFEERQGGILVLSASPPTVIRAVGAPAGPMLRLLARSLGHHIVVGPSVGELVTLDLRRVHSFRALYLLAWLHGWSVVENDDGSLVVTAGPRRPEPPLPMTPYDAQVDAIIDEIVRLARDRRVDELDVHLDALRGLVARASGRGEPPAPSRERQYELDDLRYELSSLLGELSFQTPDARAVTLDALGRTLAKGGADALAIFDALLVRKEGFLRQLLPEAREGIRLQRELHAGTLIIEAMTEALEREDSQAALEVHTTLDAVLERMRDEESEVFHRNGEALFLRARDLADRAKRVAAIAARFGPLLHVQAVFLPGLDGKEPNAAIISGVILEEGDSVPDPATGEPIKDLRVVQIEPGRVRFRYEDTEVTRAVGQAPR